MTIMARRRSMGCVSTWNTEQGCTSAALPLRTDPFEMTKIVVNLPPLDMTVPKNLVNQDEALKEWIFANCQFALRQALKINASGLGLTSKGDRESSNGNNSYPLSAQRAQRRGVSLCICDRHLMRCLMTHKFMIVNVMAI